VEAFLSQEWAGLAIAAPLAIAGWTIFRRGRALSRRALRWLVRGPAGLIAGLATVLAAGAIFHLAQRAHDRASFPPLGQLVDVGGYRLHLLAEGSAGAGPTVVWVGGGYAQGLGVYRLHLKTRAFARSVLYDHAGTGWSESGPFPRTVAREVDDLQRLLAAAGERPPFVLVGHSFGGLIANNFAARHPDAVAGLVLLDATPVASATLSAGSPQLALIQPLMRATALAHAFGLSPFITTAGGFFVPASYRKTYLEHVAALGTLQDAYRANERRVSANLAAASIIPPILAGHTDELVAAAGALGDLPMTVVYSDALDVGAWSAERTAEHRKAVKTQEEWDRRLLQPTAFRRSIPTSACS
jgi:pimeloyl-ACP methyl ester carboxylesterase